MRPRAGSKGASSWLHLPSLVPVRLTAEPPGWSHPNARWLAESAGRVDSSVRLHAKIMPSRNEITAYFRDTKNRRVLRFCPSHEEHLPAAHEVADARRRGHLLSRRAGVRARAQVVGVAAIACFHGVAIGAGYLLRAARDTLIKVG